jgi:dihydroorotate dehydrogenase
MSMQSFIRRTAFRMDPEKAHETALRALQAGGPLLVPAKGWFDKADASVHQHLMGLDFRAPVGLAAGYDKYGRAVRAWGRLGFGFAEIGTVTARPQDGNPRPRLFRLVDDEAIINRMGFNNDGAAITARRIAEARGGNGAGIPVAVNIGKSKVAPLDEAAADHLVSYRLLRGVADFVVVNVSSPNTPGLRELQDRDHLTAILGALRDEDASMRARDGRVPMPFLVKLAPDLPDAQIEDAVDLAGELGLAGVVLTNTTIAREGLLKNPADPAAGEQGGLSGPPVRARACHSRRSRCPRWVRSRRPPAHSRPSPARSRQCSAHIRPPCQSRRLRRCRSQQRTSHYRWPPRERRWRPRTRRRDSHPRKRTRPAACSRYDAGASRGSGEQPGTQRRRSLRGERARRRRRAGRRAERRHDHAGRASR